jgi:hypothetical protein
VPQKQRAASVARFQAGESQAFVFTAGAGGVGITLTKAADIILVDRALTPGDVEQAEDRVYRIGQALPVTLGIHPIVTLEKQLLNINNKTWYKVVELYCEVTIGYNPR